MIRPATPADLPALAALEQAALPDPWTPAQLAGELAQPITRALLAGDGTQPLGYALGRVVAGEAEVLRVAVHPAHRRQGLGRALLRALHAACAAEEVFLEVRAGNTAAIALYEAEGYARVGRRPGYYADGEDAVVMGVRSGLRRS